MSRTSFPPWTVGVCAVGKTDDKPPLPAKRPDLCAGYGHPGCTYNPLMDMTWCLCGAVIRDGDQNTLADQCGGPLSGAPEPDWSWPPSWTGADALEPGSEPHAEAAPEGRPS